MTIQIANWGIIKHVYKQAYCITDQNLYGNTTRAALQYNYWIPNYKWTFKALCVHMYMYISLMRWFVFSSVAVLFNTTSHWNMNNKYYRLTMRLWTVTWPLMCLIITPHASMNIIQTNPPTHEQFPYPPPSSLPPPSLPTTLIFSCSFSHAKVSCTLTCTNNRRK